MAAQLAKRFSLLSISRFYISRRVDKENYRSNRTMEQKALGSVSGSGGGTTWSITMERLNTKFEEIVDELLQSQLEIDSSRELTLQHR